VTLSPDLISFLEQGMSIHMGTRNARLEPSGARAVAVKVDDDGEHLDAYVTTTDLPAVIANLEDNGQAALAFARPADDRACQIKGTLVNRRPAEPAELAEVQRQWIGFLAQLNLVGIPEAATRRWASWPCVVIRLRVTAAFDQTPGPDAGARLP
jgi:hypothetical protein